MDPIGGCDWKAQQDATVTYFSATGVYTETKAKRGRERQSGREAASAETLATMAFKYLPTVLQLLFLAILSALLLLLLLLAVAFLYSLESV